MAVKSGVKFDYDLWANLESSIREKQRACIICGETLRCRWTCRSGEAVCLRCGCAYQLKWGSIQQEKEKNYPYCKLRTEWVPVFKEYWELTKKFTFLGQSHETTGRQEFYAWVKEHYPELMKGWEEEQ